LTVYRATLRDHPIEILAYASKHEYLDIMGEVAPLIVDRPLAEIFGVLPPPRFAAWVR